MTLTNAALFEALYDMASDLGLNLFDVRKVIPRHATKVFAKRDPEDVDSSCYHHQAAEPVERPGFLASHPEVKAEIARNGSIWTDDTYRQAVFGVAEYHIGPSSHLAQGGAPGIAYTLVVDPDGGLYFCNDVESKTWSQGTNAIPGDENERYLAVLFMGNLVSEGNPEGHAPTPAQMMVAAALWVRVFPAVGLKPTLATTHNRLGKKACPGDHITAVVEAVRAHAGYTPDLSTWLERQRALNRVGAASPPLTEDGIYGQKTKAAIVAFQRAEHLTVDGTWGPKTAAAMMQALGRLD